MRKLGVEEWLVLAVMSMCTDSLIFRKRLRVKYLITNYQYPTRSAVNKE